MTHSAPETTLDDLLGQEEPQGSFHDASILSIRVDYVTREFIADLELFVGDPDAPDEESRERRRRGTLYVTGLRVWSLEPPLTIDPAGDGLWLTGDGLLTDSPTETGKALAGLMGPDGVAWWLYFSDLNTFAYLAGERAQFAWAS